MAALLVSAYPASAINIVPVFNFIASDSPGFDPFTGTAAPAGLEGIFDYAEAYYQDVFEDAGHTLTINYWYDDLGDNTLGDHDWVSEGANGRETVANIRIDTRVNVGGALRNYFFDPTPAQDEEFTMSQTLWRDVSSADRSDWFNDGFNVPDTFEVGFTGSANAGTGATGATDMLSLVLHEVGHALGMSASSTKTQQETGDEDYDFNPAFLFGGVLAADTLDRPTDFIGHIDPGPAGMNPGLPTGSRRHMSHTDLFAMASGNDYLQLDVPRREFYGGGNWNAPGNWTGDTVPGTADDVLIRDAQGPGVIITAALSGSAFARDVSISEGANLNTGANRLLASGDVTVDGNGSDIFINPGGEAQADTIALSNDAAITMTGGTLDARLLTIGVGTDLIGTLGAANVDVSQRLANTGEIRAQDGAVMTFRTTGSSGTWDLDGIGGIGEVVAETGDLIFDNGTMDGVFDGLLTVGAGHFFRFDSAWSIGEGVIHLDGGTTTATRAYIAGGKMTTLSSGLGGGIHASGQAHFDNAVDLNPWVEVVLAAGANLEFNAVTQVDRTNFTIARGSLLEFDAAATLTGAIDIERVNAGVGDARIHFGALTTYDNATITQSGSGAVLLDITQQGDALFLGDNVINAGAFDMDGGSGANTLSFGLAIGQNVVGGSLTLNVVGVDSTSNNVFDSTLNLAGPATGNRLTVNLGGLTSSWEMAGTANLSGGTGLNAALFQTRIAGSPVALSGLVNVGSARSAIDASVTLENSAVINFENTSSNLGFAGFTLISPDVRFARTGTVTALFGSEVVLFNGVDLASSSLDNFGEVSFFGVGNASARNYTQSANGVLKIKLGGASLSQHDHLNVDSATTLDGELDLSLVSGYSPALYALHTIINGPIFGVVNGTFANIQGVQVDGSTGLAVTYTAQDVLVRRALIGDVDFDGDVDDADFGLSFAGFSGPGALGNGWVDGDMDGDGDVDDADFGLSFANFTGPGGPANVPEPASLALFALGGLIACRRR